MHNAWRRGHFLPGTMLCLAVGLVATGLASLEARLFRRAWLEALVLAIIVGTILRSLWTPSTIWIGGIRFSAKILLELAILLLGATLSAQALAAIGPGLLVGIVGVVSVAITMSYGIGRLLGLRLRMALLVACGNAICGNSAIAAVAPAIGAKAEDVATAIAFTAVLGVATVLGLPGSVRAEPNGRATCPLPDVTLRRSGMRATAASHDSAERTGRSTR